MAVKKYWVIINSEYKPELFENITWNEIKAKTESAQNYSGFPSQKEAEDVFNKLNFADLEPDPEKAKEKIENKIKNLQDRQIMLFTDGSYRDVEPRRYGAGWGYDSLYKEKGKLKEESGHGSVLALDSRQVIGETTAVDKALSYASLNDCTKVDIYCDLLDLVLWDCGFNNADKEVAKDYIRSMKFYRKELDITFHWCPSHEGIKYNEKADAEAKIGFEETYTKDQLSDKLPKLEEELGDLCDSGSSYAPSDYYDDDSDSVIEDTGRLTDNQDAYDDTIDDYDGYQRNQEIDELEDLIAKIKKILGIDD